MVVAADHAPLFRTVPYVGAGSGAAFEESFGNEQLSGLGGEGDGDAVGLAQLIGGGQFRAGGERAFEDLGAQVVRDLPVHRSGRIHADSSTRLSECFKHAGKLYVLGSWDHAWRRYPRGDFHDGRFHRFALFSFTGAAARRFVDGQLTDCSLVDLAVLIVSGLATNGVRYSPARYGGKFTVRVQVEPGWARIEVSTGR